jgi:uncharacterized membrane protein HdeD (DUF308 family)
MRWKIKLVLGVVMIAIGAYVAVRPLLPAAAAITSTRWLDVAFAAFFVIRGTMNVRSALREKGAAS